MIKNSVWGIACSFLLIAGFTSHNYKNSASEPESHPGAPNAIENRLSYDGKIFFRTEKNPKERGAGPKDPVNGNYRNRFKGRDTFDLHDVSKPGVSIIRIELNADSVTAAFDKYGERPKYISSKDDQGRMGLEPKMQYGAYEFRNEENVYSIYLIFHRTPGQVDDLKKRMIDNKREEMRAHTHGHLCDPAMGCNN